MEFLSLLILSFLLPPPFFFCFSPHFFPVSTHLFYFSQLDVCGFPKKQKGREIGILFTVASNQSNAQAKDLRMLHSKHAQGILISCRIYVSKNAISRVNLLGTTEPSSFSSFSHLLVCSLTREGMGRDDEKTRPFHTGSLWLIEGQGEEGCQRTSIVGASPSAHSRGSPRTGACSKLWGFIIIATLSVSQSSYGFLYFLFPHPFFSFQT